MKSNPCFFIFFQTQQDDQWEQSEKKEENHMMITRPWSYGFGARGKTMWSSEIFLGCCGLAVWAKLVFGDDFIGSWDNAYVSTPSRTRGRWGRQRLSGKPRRRTAVFSLANCSRRLSDLSGIVVLPSTEITKWSFKTSTIRLPFEKKKIHWIFINWLLHALQWTVPHVVYCPNVTNH